MKSDVVMDTVMDVVIIGAGMAGLTAAKQLQHRGKKVAVVEKSRGTGGRLSSKRLPLPDDQSLTFDLGCPSFSSETPQFKAQLDKWLADELIVPCANQPEYYVGRERNSSITRHIAKDLNIHFSTRVCRLEKERELWQVYTQLPTGEQLFCTAEHIVIATPPQQAYDLLPKGNSLCPLIEHIKMEPQWVLLLAVRSSTELKIDSAQHPSIKSISPEHVKRGAKPDDSVQYYQVQAGEEWSQETINWERTRVESYLLSEFEALCEQKVDIIVSHLHRWLYSLPSNTPIDNKENYLTCSEKIHLSGDYLATNQSRHGLECAYLSGISVAKQI